MKYQDHPYRTEADLCAAFIRWVQGQHRPGSSCPLWTAYAETAGWDVLLVAQDVQIGVQAKMRLNLKVLQQTLPLTGWTEQGPDFRAVLVPDRCHGFDALCDALGVTVIAPTARDPAAFAPRLDLSADRTWHWWSPDRREQLPDYVPDVPAGASGPVQLTPWKVNALRICALLQLQGHVTRGDFRRYGVDPRRWLHPNGWLQPDAHQGRYVRGPACAFDRQHPAVYAQVLADVADDLQKRGLLTAPTTGLDGATRVQTASGHYPTDPSAGAPGRAA